MSKASKVMQHVAQRFFQFLVWANYSYSRLPLAPAQWRIEELLWKYEPQRIRQYCVRRQGLAWDLNLDHGDINKAVFYKGCFEAESTTWLLTNIKPDWVCFDVGANIGYYTLLLAKMISGQGEVIAFEPTSIFGDRLRRNVSLNQISNVTIEKVGLSDKRSRESIYYDSTTASIVMDPAHREKHEEIECLSLDEYMANNSLTRLDFIKIDIDGYEPLFLNGARQTLMRFRPVLLIEVCPEALGATGVKPNDLLSTLADLGYRCEFLDVPPGLGAPLDIIDALQRKGFASCNAVCTPY